MTEHDRGRFSRREALKLGTAAAAGLAARSLLPGEALAARALPPLPKNEATPQAMPTRNLGKTGYRVGIFSLGGQAAIEQPNNADVAVPIIERALDLGVNYLDTSARYGGAERWSERYYGEVLKKRRAEAFVATKTHDRTRDGSLRLLEKSFELLHTDHVDLWQLHAVSKMEDVDAIFAKDGAIAALQRARDEKLVRFLGVTGHADPAVLMECIRRFPFDTLLMAVNAADPHHLSFTKELLPLAVEREMGVIGMKIPARGRILSTWKPSAPENQPAWVPKVTTPGTIDMKEAMRYVLSLPVSTVIIGCDSIAQLEENVAIARAFTPLSAAQMTAMEKRTEPIAKQALFFRKWT